MSGERNEYRGDVWYEVYRRGGDSDRVDDDRVDDYFDEGFTHEEAADLEMKRQRWNQAPACCYCGSSPCCCEGSW